LGKTQGDGTALPLPRGFVLREFAKSHVGYVFQKPERFDRRHRRGGSMKTGFGSVTDPQRFFDDALGSPEKLAKSKDQIIGPENIALKDSQLIDQDLFFSGWFEWTVIV
jgi:hypothetical protein